MVAYFNCDTILRTFTTVDIFFHTGVVEVNVVDLYIFLLDPDSRIRNSNLRIRKASLSRIQPDSDPDPTGKFLWPLKEYSVK